MPYTFEVTFLCSESRLMLLLVNVIIHLM
jgi:hypothetical protein